MVRCCTSAAAAAAVMPAAVVWLNMIWRMGPFSSSYSSSDRSACTYKHSCFLDSCYLVTTCTDRKLPIIRRGYMASERHRTGAACLTSSGSAKKWTPHQRMRSRKCVTGLDQVLQGRGVSRLDHCRI